MVVQAVSCTFEASVIAMTLNTDLDRFIKAQDSTIDEVFEELKRGQKESHWMWFVFPQIIGLGDSAISIQYAIRNLAEARDFIQHDVLGKRLIACVETVRGIEGKDLTDIFGKRDAIKFRSCITLFELVAEEPTLFSLAIKELCDGRRDLRTLEILEEQREMLHQHS